MQENNSHRVTEQAKPICANNTAQTNLYRYLFSGTGDMLVQTLFPTALKNNVQKYRFPQ